MTGMDTDVLAHATGRVVGRGACAGITPCTTTGPVGIRLSEVAIATPEVSAEQALVRTLVVVENASGTRVTTVVHNTVLDPYGHQVIRSSALPHVIEPATAQTASITQWVKEPALSSPDAQNLYTARTEVIVDGSVVNRVEKTFTIGLTPSRRCSRSPTFPP